ncbi:MAG: hypothetical protein R3C05_04160 [Pirellulaceae bacterium]
MVHVNPRRRLRQRGGDLYEWLPQAIPISARSNNTSGQGDSVTGDSNYTGLEAPVIAIDSNQTLTEPAVRVADNIDIADKTKEMETVAGSEKPAVETVASAETPTAPETTDAKAPASDSEDKPAAPAKEAVAAKEDAPKDDAPDAEVKVAAAPAKSTASAAFPATLTIPRRSCKLVGTGLNGAERVCAITLPNRRGLRKRGTLESLIVAPGNGMAATRRTLNGSRSWEAKPTETPSSQTVKSTSAPTTALDT